MEKSFPSKRLPEIFYIARYIAGVGGFSPLPSVINIPVFINLMRGHGDHIQIKQYFCKIFSQ
jgi:hypothetical protein